MTPTHPIASSNLQEALPPLPSLTSTDPVVVEEVKGRPLSLATTDLKGAFEKRNTVWMHGDEVIHKIVIDKLKEEAKEPLFYFSAPISQEEFIARWSEFYKIQDLEKRTDSPCLIILTRLSFEHFDALSSILTKHRAPHRKFLLCSKEELGEKSLAFSVDKTWYETNEVPERLQRLFPNNLKLLLLVTCLIKNHNLTVDAFIAEWKKPKKGVVEEDILKLFIVKDPFLEDVLATLSLFEKTPLNEDFLKEIFKEKDKALSILRQDQLITEQGNQTFVLEYTLPKKGDEAMLQMALRLRSIERKNLEDIAPVIAAYFYSHCFSESSSDEKKSAEKKERHFQSSPEAFVALLSLMLEIAHDYTQKSSIDLAKKYSEDARESLEWFLREFLGRKRGGKGGTGPTHIPQDLCQLSGVETCMTTLREIHPLLAPLYIQLQYQIGRIYFYQKNPDEKEGSESVLTYALALSREYEKQTQEKLFVGMSIERNGLLFHDRERGNFAKVIGRYRELLEDQAPYIDINYQTREKKEMTLREDKQHRITCLQYLVETKIQNKETVDQEIRTLYEEIGGLQKDKTGRLLSLAHSYVQIGNLKEAKEILSSLEASISKENIEMQLKLLKGRIEFYLKQEDFPQVAELARSYRMLAPKYFSTSTIAPFALVLLENQERARKVLEHGLSYLSQLEGYINSQLNNKPLCAKHFRLENDLLLFDLHSDDPAEMVLFKSKQHFSDPVIAPHSEMRKQPLACSSEAKKEEEKPLYIQTYSISLDREQFVIPGLQPLHDNQKNKKHNIETTEDSTHLYIQIGKKRSITMTREFANYLKDNGEWEEFKATLENGTFFSTKDNKFALSCGYRIKEDLKPVSFSKLDLKELPLFTDDVWSDDEEDLQALEEKTERFQGRRVKLQEKNRALRAESTFYPNEDFVEDSFLKEQEKYKTELEKELNVPRAVKELAYSFYSLEGKDQLERQEFAESFLEKKWAVQERQLVDQRNKTRFETIDAELQSLKEREAYLKFKKEKLSKRHIQQLTNYKIADISNKKQTIESIQETFKVAQSLPIAQKTERGEPHFKNPPSFVYHALKHQDPPPFTEVEGHIVFNRSQYEDNATTYLEETRRLAREGKNLIISIPDQHIPGGKTTRYFNVNPLPSEVIQKRIELSKELKIREKERRRTCQTEKNLGYTKSSNKQITQAKKIAKKSIEKINGQLKDLSASSIRKCDFTVVFEPPESGASAPPYFKTHFETQVHLDKLPKGVVTFERVDKRDDIP